MSTTDPGIEDAIREQADDADQDISDSTADDDDNYMTPSRWWFASTICPLLAGTFGPIANGFSICALAISWREKVGPGVSEADGSTITDLPWTLAINALSLAFALVGNLSLLLNMAQRLQFSIAQPITISGFFMAGILLVADMAALVSSPTYFLTSDDEAPWQDHALSSAFYYAIFASVFYFIIGALMCVTVYGGNAGYYDKEFRLTPSQRTLMLQTMLFVTYLLLGALVFSRIEGWNYLDAVYWADVTLLTVGLGDFSPQTDLGRGLLFPFGIGGILMIGLVVGSIRSLVLERGQEKMAARIMENRRSTAIHNVDEHKQTIKVSFFAKADFSTDPSLSPAQRREEEFHVMRKVLNAAEDERRWFSLVMSFIFTLLLWFVGAAIFMVTEQVQGWSYFESLYFTYVCLLTIGYGDITPVSNSGKAFFVVWSLLAVPSLTILISNMGDTIVKWFADLTDHIGALTILPGNDGFRAGVRPLLNHLFEKPLTALYRITPPGILGTLPRDTKRLSTSAMEHERNWQTRMAERLTKHFEDEELDLAVTAQYSGNQAERDKHFFHYVLSREIRALQRVVNVHPPKKYTWEEWEYYLRLMGNDNTSPHLSHDDLVPSELRATSHASFPLVGDGVVDRETERREYDEAHARRNRHNHHHPHPHLPTFRHRPTYLDLNDWSWLSKRSPLMSSQSETEWILERLTAALELELNHQRKGIKTIPPIRLKDIRQLIEKGRQEEENAEQGEG